MALQAGDKAPDFKLENTTGDTIQLSSSLKGQACIIYFYPKDFTPGCTKEACSFRDNFDFFQELDIRVIGISTDNKSSHQKFKAKYQLPFDLLSDTTGHVSKAYQALIPFLNVSKRITYLLDSDHIIRGVYSDLFGYEAHIRAMIAAIKSADQKK
ncbi:MAG TPA: peroxiredoxin [Cyclobacteriaceae bacterium]|mgnify:CR=1 FL=1|nr:peroxiredoxin [Cyclobacteriaceae bacterium]